VCTIMQEYNGACTVVETMSEVYIHNGKLLNFVSCSLMGIARLLLNWLPVLEGLCWGNASFSSFSSLASHDMTGI
jgi:hypothetical protein